MDWLVGEHEAPSLQNHGRLTTEQLLAFFKEAAKEMTSDDSKARLRDAVRAGEDAGEAITQLQKGVLRKQGIDGDFGMEYMAHVGTDYRLDAQVMPRFFEFVQCEGDLLDEVENVPELVEEVKVLKQQLFAMIQAKTTAERPVQDNVAAQQQTMLRMQQTRMALLTKWTSEQGMPDDADLPLPLQRDFHRWALEQLSDAPAAAPTLPPVSQQMD